MGKGGTPSPGSGGDLQGSSELSFQFLLTSAVFVFCFFFSPRVFGVSRWCSPDGVRMSHTSKTMRCIKVLEQKDLGKKKI